MACQSREIRGLRGSSMKSTFDKLTKNFDYQAIFAAIELDREKDLHHTESRTCDDVEGRLCVTLACDSDVHVSVEPTPRSTFQLRPSFRCRTHAGGGRSERVRKALLLLMLAMHEEKASDSRAFENTPWS